MDIFADVSVWHWWSVGLLFVVLEIFSPAVFFLWMGVAAGLVGVVMLVFPSISWEGQLIVFSVVSVASTVLSRQYLQRHPIQSDRPLLNRRGHQYIGRTFTLDAPIVNGFGKIKVDDTTWKIEGADCGAGLQVKVTGVNGVVLKVEVVEAP